MHKSTVVVLMCMMVTATMTIPLSQKRTFGKNGNAVITEAKLNNVIFLRHLSTLYTRNYFSDIIRATLGLSVRELLLKIDSTFKDLDRVTNQGVAELDQVLHLASPEIQAELVAVRNNAINKVFEIIGGFLRELARVLPVLSPQFSTYDPSADIIYALLGKTLEDFVTQMATALNQSLQLLLETIANFKALATRAKPEVANALNKITNEYLYEGRSIITPMLDQLEQLVDLHQINTRTSNNGKQHKDFLDGIISALLGVDIESTGLEADKVLSELVPLFETTREELYEAFTSTQGNGTDTSAGNEVQTNVMNIYDNAIDDAIRDAKPILTALLQFEGKARQEKTFVYDMSDSLLGIDVDTFKSYIKNASSRIENTIKSSKAQILAASTKAGIPTFLKIWRILHEKLRSAKRISESFMDYLKSISDHTTVERNENSINVKIDEEEATWSENDGTPYNRDALISAASQLLGLEVTEATTTLKTSLEKLDELMEYALVELQIILSEPEVDADMRMDILETMNDTLTDIHITLQPMLDVLLPFLPDEIRSNKRVALDIYAGTNGVNVGSFKRYSSSAARKIPEITGIATIRIKTIATRAGPNVYGKVESLLQITDHESKSIVQPFIEIVGPIISQH